MPGDIAAVVAAGAWVHRGDEHKICGEAERAVGSGDADRAVFQRLPQNFEHIFFELGQFVQKQDAVVRKRHLAWFWERAAADEGDVADGVVRRAERSCGDDVLLLVDEFACDGVDFGGL